MVAMFHERIPIGIREFFFVWPHFFLQNVARFQSSLLKQNALFQVYKGTHEFAKFTKQLSSLVLLPPVTEPLAFVSVLVGFIEIIDISTSSSRATTCATLKYENSYR